MNYHVGASFIFLVQRLVRTSMSDSQYITKGPDRKPVSDIDKTSKKFGISAASITSTVRSFMPPKKSKYDSHDKIDELYMKWFTSAKKPAGSLSEKVLLYFYEFYKPRIMSIAKRYRSLSPVFDDDDLLQTALLGILQALIKYNHATHVAMKFSTYLEWSVRNIFQRNIGCSDKFVEIYNENNDLLLSLGYHEFISRKKVIESSGHTYSVRSRLCYFSDIANSGDFHICMSAQDDIPFPDPCDPADAPTVSRHDGGLNYEVI